MPVRRSPRYRRPPIHVTDTAHPGCLRIPINYSTPLVTRRQFDSFVPTALANGWLPAPPVPTPPVFDTSPPVPSNLVTIPAGDSVTLVTFNEHGLWASLYLGW